MPSDRDLLQIVDAALADATRRGGAWLVCRPGCFECCIGPFGITALDARRLRQGLRELEAGDPERASRVRRRARESAQRLALELPGATLAQVLDQDQTGDDELCPALDPETGTCDLYAHRPITCRMFGPPVRFDGGSLAVCELCFQGATPEEVEACELKADSAALEAELTAQLEGEGETTVAWALDIATVEEHGPGGPRH